MSRSNRAHHIGTFYKEAGQADSNEENSLDSEATPPSVNENVSSSDESDRGSSLIGSMMEEFNRRFYHDSEDEGADQGEAFATVGSEDSDEVSNRVSIHH